MPRAFLARSVPLIGGLSLMSALLPAAPVLGGDSGMMALAGAPVAVVESVNAPATKLQPMDLLASGQSFDLGPAGKLALSYLSGCRSEVITGGVVRISADGATSDGGKVQATVASGCQSAAPIMRADASEAGAVALRQIDGDLSGPPPRVLRSPSPIFKWLAGGPGEIRVIDPNQTPPLVVWAGQADGWMAYPADAPRLKTNIIYQIEVHAGAHLIGSGRFMIDPALPQPDTTANRLVPVAQP